MAAAQERGHADRTDVTLRAEAGLVCSADSRASQAGLAALLAGGSAADAAVAANAVLAVTSPHLCGLGGDLYALVHRPGAAPPSVLSATGRAGAGADAAALRREGHAAMPFTGDLRTVTVPGCVDGWLALHAAHGRLPLADLLAPARQYAAAGFRAAPLLAGALPLIAQAAGRDDFFPGGAPARPGQLLTRPGVARALDAIASGGRDGFYLGEFGQGLLALGAGLFTEADLRRDSAQWEEPVSAPAWGHVLWTAPPPSQGYLTLLSAAIADGLPLGPDPDDPAFVHLLAEGAAAAGCDRLSLLHDGASVAAVLAPGEAARRRAWIAPGRRARLGAATAPGGTTSVCVVDRDGLGVSLLESNAAGFGSRLFEPVTRINLHNRGIGFSLTAGHPAELAPGRRPPSTLSPLVVTRPDGSLRGVLGTRGGDTQPQILLQLLARWLHAGQSPAAAMAAPRWELAARASNGFNTWTAPGDLVLQLEPGAPASWADALRAAGHEVRVPGAVFGHAQLIDAGPGGLLSGAADHRAVTGGTAGQ